MNCKCNYQSFVPIIHCVSVWVRLLAVFLTKHYVRGHVINLGATIPFSWSCLNLTLYALKILQNV